jgi:GT2 family glycosyltransferase
VTRPMAAPHHVAVLLTVHNRRAKTLACLGSLAAQEAPGCRLTIHLVDDGCTDGTAAAVRATHPDVRVIAGDGTLYWSGGMARAELDALADDPDHLLWLNDDVDLAPGAVAALTCTSAELAAAGRSRAIVVGAMRDPRTGATTYSGVRRHGKVRPNRFIPVEPGSAPIRCDTMNGNLVLVPRTVRQVVGGFDPVYTHALNDLDYGLRASAAGCEVWLAPGHLGDCANDRAEQWWCEGDPPPLAQLRRFCSPTGLPPRDWLRFNRRHAGWLWPVTSVTPYARVTWRATRRRARRGLRLRRGPTGQPAGRP